jgi:N utilization substance protein B
MAKSASRPSRPGGRKSRSAGTSAARLAAVQGLYEIEIAGASFDSVLMDHMHDRWSGLQGHTSGDDLDRKKFADLVRGVTVSKARYDRMIEETLEKGRKTEGLDVLLLSILRAAVHELFAEPKVPARVVIDEYMTIAHAFYADNEPALVNGVLNRIAHVLRAAELGERTGD